MRRCGLCRGGLRGGLRGGRLRFIGQREVILALCSHAVGVGPSVVPLNFNPAWGSEVKQQFQHYMNNHVSPLVIECIYIIIYIHMQSAQRKENIFIINVLLCNCLYNAKKIYSLVSLIMRVAPPIFVGIRLMVVLLGQLIEY